MIGLNDFSRQWSEVGQAVHSAVERVGASGSYILGDEVTSFEVALADLFGSRFAVGVGNGMDAIEIALRSLGLQPNDKVLTTPLSAFATTLAIIRAQGVPVFADVDHNGLLDLKRCRQVLEHDRSIRFMVPVHLYGLPMDLEGLHQLKRDFELVVIEDCAQAVGASFGGAGVGKIGQAAATSFYPTKNLGALGDGGAIITDDAEVKKKASVIRNYGQQKTYEHEELGLNSRLDELQAAILREALLPQLRQWTARRRCIAQFYLEHIRNRAITLLAREEKAEPVWHLFPILLPSEEREAFRQYMTAGGVTTGIHYPTIIPEQPILQKRGGYQVATDLQRSRAFTRSEVSLPIHPFLTDSELEQVTELCNAWKDAAVPRVTLAP